MIFLAYTTSIVIIYQTLVVLINLVTLQRLPSVFSTSDELISVLIPARDEEENIANLLNDLLQQPYRNVEICVYDDQSSDGTAIIVKRFAEMDSRVRLISGVELPQGWKGKNHACYQLAKNAQGNYFLFLDADVRLQGSVLSRMAGYMRSSRVGMISIFPNQQMLTRGEWMIVPLMNHILLTLLPLRAVELLPFSSLSAANGQCMMYDQRVYRQWEPHLAVKDERVEDIRIARFLKKRGERVACLASESAVRCRMYFGYAEAMSGFSKNVVMFFGNSFLLSFLYAIFSSVGVFFTAIWGWQWLFIFILLNLMNRIVTSFISQQSIWMNLLFFGLQQLSLIVLLFNAIIQRFTNRTLWKGRLV